MNQSRLRKSSAVGESGRPRLSKVSGEAGKNMSRDLTKESREHPKNHHHNHCKTIPKNIRYDLENALVGLCDVWFEDIKPYLLRNNIKLHVPCNGGGAGEAAAGGDRSQLPGGGGGAQGCSHVDPGAATDHRRRRNVSSASCSTEQPPTSKPRLHRPPQHPCKVPCLRRATTPTENPRNTEESELLSNHAGSPSLFPFKVPLETQYTITQVSYFSSLSPHSEEVSSNQNITDTKDHGTQTDIRRRSPKRSRTKSPAKTRARRVKRQKSPSPIPVKRQQSPSSKRQCSPIRKQRSPTKDQESHQSPSRQPRIKSSSPIRRKGSPTLVATSPVRAQKSSAKKSDSSIPRACIEYRNKTQCQDELDNILGAPFDPYVKYGTLKTENNPATLKLKPSQPKKQRVKSKPPWR